MATERRLQGDASLADWLRKWDPPSSALGRSVADALDNDGLADPSDVVNVQVQLRRHLNSDAGLRDPDRADLEDLLQALDDMVATTVEV